MVAWGGFFSYWNSQIIKIGEERIIVQKKTICFLRFKCMIKLRPAFNQLEPNLLRIAISF